MPGPWQVFSKHWSSGLLGEYREQGSRPLTGLEAERREAQRRFRFLPAVLMGSRTQAGPSGLEAAAGSECRSCSAHATRRAVFLRKA